MMGHIAPIGELVLEKVHQSLTKALKNLTIRIFKLYPCKVLHWTIGKVAYHLSLQPYLNRTIRLYFLAIACSEVVKLLLLSKNAQSLQPGLRY